MRWLDFQASHLRSLGTITVFAKRQVTMWMSLAASQKLLMVPSGTQ